MLRWTPIAFLRALKWKGTVSRTYQQQGMSSGKQFKLGLNTQPNTQLVSALTELSLQPLKTDIPHASSEALKPASSMSSYFFDKASSCWTYT